MSAISDDKPTGRVRRIRTQRMSSGRRRLRDISERLIQGALFLAGSSSVVITLAIVAVLFYESAGFFRHVSLVEFLTGTTWTPQFAGAKYGILPLVAGTVVTTAVALAVALPIGTIVALYLSEFAPPALREIIKPSLELLSAVPTVVYGYFALSFVAPLLQAIVPSLPTFNMLCAGLVMGIMIIPYVSSLSEDAMRSVPMILREGSYALGGNKTMTAINVVVPSALSGIGAAYILGISRAIGETMIVAIAAGMRPNFTLNPTQPAATITAFIVQVCLGDLPHGSVGYQSIFAAGLVLFFMTLLFNVIGHYFRRRLHQAY
jgi:phosphate transport system permease protein